MAEFNETQHNNYIEGVVDARCLIFLNRIIRPLVEDQTLTKTRILVLQTFMYVDEGFSKTVGQNSMGNGTIMEGVIDASCLIV